MLGVVADSYFSTAFDTNCIALTFGLRFVAGNAQ